MPLERTDNISVLFFDVFGTVVDWHGSVVREVEEQSPGVSGNDFRPCMEGGVRARNEESHVRRTWLDYSR